MTKDILQEEMGLKVLKSRFYHDGFYYPIKLVTFQKEQLLGQFDSDTLTIGLHHHLAWLAKNDVIKNILRHELAHYFCFIEKKYHSGPHGKDFKDVCRQFGWGADVFQAYASIEHLNQNVEGDLKTERLIEKVKNLFKLAASANVHEAELAVLKANQLLLKHHLDQESLTSNPRQKTEIFVKRLHTQGRKDAKLQAIYQILSHFLVAPVYNYGDKKVFLEVTGTLANVEMADYVCQYLLRHLDFLWEQQTSLMGLSAKNSFYHGLSEGFKVKQQKIKDQFSPQAQNQLVVLADELNWGLKMAYGSLRGSGRTIKLDDHAYEKGKKAGQNLAINPALKNNSNVVFLIS